MGRFILSLDQGTTSSRAIVFDGRGRVASMAQREFAQIFPRPGWVEHDPGEIWRSQLATARDAIDEAGLEPRDIAAIGITNQRETAIVWDRKTGEPVSNAIVWQDRRTAEYCSELQSSGLGKRVTKTTGLVIDAYFSGTKIRWLLDNVPGARARAEQGELAFGTVDTWLVWNLTGGNAHLTDATNACRTLLADIHTLDWSQEMLGLFDIPSAILPEIRSSSEVYAVTDPALFGVEIPIAGIAGDQHAALFGQACLQPGMAKNTYGTGSFLLMNTGTEPVRSANHLLTTVAWKIGDSVEYALEGSVFITGAAVQWLRDQLGIISRAAEIEDLARQVPDAGGVYFVPAFTGLGAPHWDGFARGTITGLTRGSNKAHLARAALDAIALQSRDVLVAMTSDSGIDLAELRVDGGASANVLLMQIQADLLGVPVVRPTVSETTALGAAYLAGLAAGVWDSRETIANHWEVDRRYDPAPDSGGRAEHIARWEKAVARARAWA